MKCGERLVDTKLVAPIVTVQMPGPRLKYAGKQVLYARETVCKMLGKAAGILAPGYTLVLFDAYRPIAYQRMRYKEACEHYRARFPEISEREIEVIASQVVFPPDENPDTPPPHTTGGAVGVTIVHSDGSPIDVGSLYGVYDPEENQKHFTNSSLITSKQREKRVRLITAMVEAGFCNYPGEW